MPWATSQFKRASGRFVFRGRLDDKPVLPPHGYLHLVFLVTEQAINSQINEERQRDLASVRVDPRTARSHGLREVVLATPRDRRRLQPELRRLVPAASDEPRVT